MHYLEMKYKFGLLLIISTMSLWSNGQNTPKLPPGFPDRSPKLDVLPGFKNPPKGYGEVSFYWWLGDTLTKERILTQLDQLKDKSITGLQINYCHTDKGGATYGLTYPSQPALFSAKWWELLQWFLKEAKKRDMSVSLSDYTLGAAGQGWYVDEMLNENPGLHGAKLESKQWDVIGGKDFKSEVHQDVITAKAFKTVNGKIDANSAIDLIPGIKNNELNWQSPVGDWKIILVYRNTIKSSWDPMNPLSGKKVIEKFYQRFEDQVFAPALLKPKGLPRLRQMIHSWLKMSVGDETSSCFFISGAAEFDDRPGIVRDALIQSVEDWRAALRRAIKESVVAGDFKKNIDIDVLLFQLYSIVLGVHHDSRFLQNPKSLTLANKLIKDIFTRNQKTQ